MADLLPEDDAPLVSTGTQSPTPTKTTTSTTPSTTTDGTGAPTVDSGTIILPPTTVITETTDLIKPHITVAPSSINFKVNIDVQGLPVPYEVPFQVNIDVKPAIPTFKTPVVAIDSSLTLVPIPVNLDNAIVNIMHRLLEGKIESFYDETRELKTLLNFGRDYQALITNWKFDPKDATQSSILVKLYQPLPTSVALKKQLWITRELAPTLIDQLHLIFTPSPGPKVYLRPPNRNVQVTGRDGISVENITLSGLIASSSYDVIGADDPVVHEWFTHDINASELNVDYADYRNFVFFGSAQSRLDAFIEKLKLLESYNSVLTFNSASLTVSGSGALSASLSYPALQGMITQKTDLIRSFDPYERFLYYTSGSPYSASLSTDDYQDAFYYQEDATFPKVSGSIAAVTSSVAQAWYASQSVIASAYDLENPNSLRNNIPSYLQNDADSTDFIKFLDLVGHHFDLIKPYIDQMPNIYDRDSDPSVGLSPDLVWNVAKAFGVELPNQYALKNVLDYTIGSAVSINASTYRNFAAETWKRFLHNQVFFMKSKGTKQGLRDLANSYGVLPTTVRVRESVTPSVLQASASFEVYEELSNAVQLLSGSFIDIPWSGSSPVTIETRFSTTNANTSVLMNAGNIWSVMLEPLTGSWGRVMLKSGSTTTVSSSYMELFDGSFFSTMVRYDASGVNLQVKKAFENTFDAESDTTEASAKVASVWDDPTHLYLGGSGSFFGNSFAGFIDEFRVWSEATTDDTFDAHVKYPGLYSGNTTGSAASNLLVRLSFNKPRNLGSGSASDKYLLNESPYARALNPSASLYKFAAVGFANQTTFPYNMTIVNRDVLRRTANAGADNYSTNKVIVGDAPVYTYLSGSTVPVLARDKSIVPVQDKKSRNTPTNTVGFYFSIADAINDSIIRSLGDIDLQTLIGDPSDLYESRYSDLEAMNRVYTHNYAYTYNQNTFVNFVRNILDPMFRQARGMAPGRTQLLTGIVHEPHMLERAKVPLRPVVIDKDMSVDAPAISGSIRTSSGDYLTQDATVRLNNVADVLATDVAHEATVESVNTTSLQASVPMHEANILTDESVELEAIAPSYEATYDVATVNVGASTFVMYDDFTSLLALKQQILERFGASSVLEITGDQRAYYNKVTSAYNGPYVINIVQDYVNPSTQAMYPSDVSASNATQVAIGPYSDFTKIEAITYFTDPNGLIGVEELVQTRLGQNILRDRGIWAAGTVYSRNDYVIQSGSISGSEGNDKEFTCITTDSQFTSHIPPYLDTANWKRTQYVKTSQLGLRKAIVISGSVSIAPAGSSKPAAIGYRPEHYRFARDRRLGILNHQWLGCLQTEDTTPDGKDPVEITTSKSDILIVRNPGDPIQPDSNNSGPILDIT